MSEEFELLKDEVKNKKVRYISFMGNLQRYDFAFMENEDDPSKVVVIYLQKNRFGIIGKEELRNKGHLEHIFHETQMEADEIRKFLNEIL
ncbi:DUF3055 family protein [Virgibacillus halodenitrificans]|jgi:hypothetical protein|uniref:Cytoplasmic protein n=1 Tax=Virgibacillus halodenitrificans TaxID=1482 RepID=A0AAC9J0M6_VIRHA|nr:SAV0927 family protein [Virgibacillus halodenitrificans]APC48932.1 cytoplasmic protein [Virgibacillus halodenitrificans]MBD1223393.1 DUF3055 family protein [Virgibacillus halodenitrificans]MCG1026971.1 DUF3055 family protein [Virgibacillus halodenitrificans]MEC2159019.1 DUF3055 family protein [Virgibacillus halodenitrificans]MYL56832.1 DUF3055 family protein [Virgibacillus halodenitrificans]